MGSFSFTHILLIVFILLILFGPNKLPQLGQSLGRAIRGFKDGLNEINGEAREVQTKNETQNQQLRHEEQARSEQHQRETSDQKKS